MKFPVIDTRTTSHPSLLGSNIDRAIAVIDGSLKGVTYDDPCSDTVMSIMTRARSFGFSDPAKTAREKGVSLEDFLRNEAIIA
jgi:hypothetical protein